MPLKSKELRLSQATSLEAEWATSAFANDKAHNFIKDMIWRLGRGKGLSAGQRRWLDQLIDNGVPSVPESNAAAVTSVENAIKTLWSSNPLDYKWEINVLRDFLGRVAKGYSMSEKQQALLDRLISEAAKISSGNAWSPSEEEVQTLKAAAQLYHGYSRFWKADRPAVRRAVESVEAFMAGDATSLKEAHAKKLLHAVRGRLKSFQTPRFSTGDIGKHTRFGRLICMADAYIREDGAIVNDWLTPDGTLVTKKQDDVYKR